MASSPKDTLAFMTPRSSLAVPDTDHSALKSRWFPLSGAPHLPTPSQVPAPQGAGCVSSGPWTAVDVHCSLREINSCDKLPAVATGDRAKACLCKRSRGTLRGKAQGRTLLNKCGAK